MDKKKRVKEGPNKLIKNFLNGKVFVKISSKKGYNYFINEVQKFYPEIMTEISKETINDFGKNKLSKEYHLVYFKPMKKIKCAEKEFFDYVYKTAWLSQGRNTNRKLHWIEV